ncbi:ATP-grasp domain-containing protein [Actinomycetospora sp.]|uniref:carboxylate--amine ligase n=1 Tax=Actinomycetospora sp. TaxID=1872135 RepID=UPI002F40BD72
MSAVATPGPTTWTDPGPGPPASPRRTPGAVVLGGDYQGLGIARSLGRRGVPVCVVDDERSPAAASRYVSHHVRVADLHADAAALDALDRLAGAVDVEGWVIYPTRDENVAMLARYADRLGRTYRVPTPGWDAVRVCWDKRETYRLAAELGVPHPRTWVPADEAGLELVEASAPLVVKPAIKEHFFYTTGEKAWRADGAAELADAYRRAVAVTGPGEILVQELVPGGGSEQYSYCAFVKRGRPVAVMTVRRRRQHPSDFGRASTFVETVEVPEIEGPSERFLAALKFDGLVEMEYKRDPRDGVHKLLDVNARTWGYHTLGGVAGVDFPYLLYRDQIGAGVPEVPVRARPGVRWVRLATDLPNSVRDIAGGTLRARDYLRTLPSAHAEAVFCARDPLPWFYEAALLPYLALTKGL